VLFHNVIFDRHCYNIVFLERLYQLIMWSAFDLILLSLDAFKLLKMVRRKIILFKLLEADMVKLMM